MTSWAIGEQVKVIRMLPSFRGNKGEIVAGQLQDKYLTIRDLDSAGNIKEIGSYPVRFINDIQPGMWSLFDCPKINQRILIQARN